jgi:hypothetical protein
MLITGAVVSPRLRTATIIDAVAVLPAASLAEAVSVRDPLTTLVVFQEKL